MNSSGTVSIGLDLLGSDEERDGAIVNFDASTGLDTIAAREGDPIGSILPNAELGRKELFVFTDRTTENFLDDSSAGGISDDGSIAFNFGVSDDGSGLSGIIPQRGNTGIQSSTDATDEAIFIGFNGPSPQIVQTRVTPIGGALNPEMALMTNPNFGRVRVSPDGSSWLASVSLDRPPLPDLAGSTSNAIVVDGDLAFVRNSLVDFGSGPEMLDNILFEDFEPSNRLSLVAITAAGGAALIGDDVVARDDEPIVPGSAKTWSPFERDVGSTILTAFFNLAENTDGDYVVSGFTDDADPGSFGTNAHVLSGRRVILERGDPLDLDGDGVADGDAFVGLFTIVTASPEGLGSFLTEDGWFYTVVGVHSVPNPGTEDRDPDPVDEALDIDESTYRGEAFIRVRAFEPTDPDTDFDGVGTVFDTIRFLELFDAGSEVRADLVADGGLDSADIERHLLDLAGLIGS